MIKIIEKGKTEFTATCKICGCKFFYEYNDMIFTHSVKCPFCNAEVEHPDQSLVSNSSINKSEKFNLVESAKLEEI